MGVGALLTSAGILAMRAPDPVRRAGVDGGRALRLPGLGQQPADACRAISFRTPPSARCLDSAAPPRRWRASCSPGAPARSSTRSATRRCFSPPASSARSGLVVTLALAGRIHAVAIAPKGMSAHDSSCRRVFVARPRRRCPRSRRNTFATFDELLAHKVALKPELVGVHPRVFVTKSRTRCAARARAHDASRRLGEGDAEHRRVEEARRRRFQVRRNAARRTTSHSPSRKSSLAYAIEQQARVS